MAFAELSRLAPGETTSPWSGYERYCGYGVMALPFSRGDVLALRVFPRTDFGGYISAADAAEPVDCRVRRAPRALLLVMYGRLPAWRAALTGKVWARGRRPWLALSGPPLPQP